ncbi:hypothetical protein A3Q56_05838, partial [Intoshia linei]
ESFGLTLIDDKKKKIWLESDKTLSFYKFPNNGKIYYTSKSIKILIQFIDKSYYFELSIVLTLKDEIKKIGKKFGIIQEDQYAFTKKDGDDWINMKKKISTLELTEQDKLTLRRKFFYTNTNRRTLKKENCDIKYEELKNGVVFGNILTNLKDAIFLAAIQLFVENSQFLQAKKKKEYIVQYTLSAEYKRHKNIYKDVKKKYKCIAKKESQNMAKLLYISHVESIEIFGFSFFSIDIINNLDIKNIQSYYIAENYLIVNNGFGSKFTINFPDIHTIHSLLVYEVLNEKLNNNYESMESTYVAKESLLNNKSNVVNILDDILNRNTLEQYIKPSEKLCVEYKNRFIDTFTSQEEKTLKLEIDNLKMLNEKVANEIVKVENEWSVLELAQTSQFKSLNDFIVQLATIKVKYFQLMDNCKKAESEIKCIKEEYDAHLELNEIWETFQYYNINVHIKRFLAKRKKSEEINDIESYEPVRKESNLDIKRGLKQDSNKNVGMFKTGINIEPFKREIQNISLSQISENSFNIDKCFINNIEPNMNDKPIDFNMGVKCNSFDDKSEYLNSNMCKNKSKNAFSISHQIKKYELEESTNGFKKFF